ncbi:Phosphoenolpyruvate carboxylase [Artemisia annua]|uniref:Phosphoenolpyruvate carboxylase n=1 Tax=Artemisia annua TaxID=35608 RepID=A0A2U1M8S8_ARTAN|nr:Phosphoenolpyruvate carboxylase [Artemisia annua]
MLTLKVKHSVAAQHVSKLWNIKLVSACLIRAAGIESTAEFLEKQLASELSKMTLDEALKLARAFSHFLSLMGIAETHHRSHKSKNVQASKSCDDTFNQLIQSGLSPDVLYDTVCNQAVEIVLTAHPTQINRRTLQYKHIRISHLLEVNDRKDLTQEDQDGLIEDLVREITSIWQTDELRRHKPTPVDEARAGLNYVEQSLWKAIPHYLRRLSNALKKELLELLSGGKSIAQLLPNKFVANLLSRREGSLLNLNPEVVSEAFLSIEDPLLIMCSGYVNPKINAPCAIFVDLMKSKEEITSELFSTKTTLCVQNPSNNDGCEMSPRATCSDTLPVANLDVNPVDECKGEQQTNRKVEDEIFEILTGKKEKLPSSVCIKCMIRKEFNRNINTLATALTNGNQWPKEDMAFVFSALSELKAFSEVLNKRSKKVEDHSVSEKTLQEVLKWLQSNTPKINDIMNRSAMSQESEDGKMLVSENSYTTEVDETSEKNHNEETGDDDSLVKVVLENNTQEVKIKKVKGNNKAKKGKKGKGELTELRLMLRFRVTNIAKVIGDELRTFLLQTSSKEDEHEDLWNIVYEKKMVVAGKNAREDGGCRRRSDMEVTWMKLGASLGSMDILNGSNWAKKVIGFINDWRNGR